MNDYTVKSINLQNGIRLVGDRSATGHESFSVTFPAEAKLVDVQAALKAVFPKARLVGRRMLRHTGRDWKCADGLSFEELLTEYQNRMNHRF